MSIPASLDLDAIIARMKAHPLGQEPADMRRAFRQLVLGGAGRPDDGPLSFRPIEPDPDMAPIVWLHGGGYVFGGPDTHARTGRYLCDTHGFVVHLPRLPLAPDHRWPAQRDEAREAVEEIAAAGQAPILAGDSSGGHLALVIAMALARAGRPVRALLLCSPNTDRTGMSRSREANAGRDLMVDPEEDERLSRMCFGEREETDPEVSPLLDDLSLLPPTWIEVGSEEVLLDDARLLAQRARKAGVEVEFSVKPGLLHMAQVWAGHWDAADASLDRAAAFARRYGASQGEDIRDTEAHPS